MRIERAELFDLVLPLAEPFIISGGAVPARHSLIVVLHDEHGHVGYGEAPPFDLPFYSEETVSSARALISEVLFPRVRGRECDGAESLDVVLRENVRGNPFARAGVETAAWDLEAACRGIGLAALVSERLHRPTAATVPCGVALGIPEDRNPDTLARRVARAVERGYRRVKIKVAPGWDAVAVGAARRGLEGSNLPLTVDANGAYRWPEDEGPLRLLDNSGLLYIEQPLAPDELVGHAQLRRALQTPICLDETVRSATWARQIAALEGPQVWNIKVHRVGGLAEVCRIYRIAEEYGADLWAGTMPESGIGSQAVLAVAGLPRFVYTSDLEPSDRWFGPRADVIELEMGRDGRMAVPIRSAGQLLDSGRFAARARLIDS